MYKAPLNMQGLSKSALAVLEKTEKLSVYYKQNMPNQRHISLYKKDYESLAKSLEANGQNIENVTYHGFSFKRWEPVAKRSNAR